jgi:hypothetical protein
MMCKKSESRRRKLKPIEGDITGFVTGQKVA